MTGSRVLWQLSKASKVSTPLCHEGLLYWVDTHSMAVCVKAETGKVVYEKLLEFSGGGDKVYASPVLADGKLYVVSRREALRC